MYSMVQAGSMGVPFVAVRGLLGSDILRHRGDLRVVENPFQEAESVVVAEPIRPEVAVFHARRADRFGNSLVPGGMRDDLMMARAGRWVVVTAEEIQEKEIRPEEAGVHTFLPAVDVDQVSPAPFGAHPGSCGLDYSHDAAHIEEYLAAAKEEASFKAYLDKYVYSPRNHQEYLALVGLRPQGKGRETA
jgi:glutaconate CoA-transferase, subunit A